MGLHHGAGHSGRDPELHLRAAETDEVVRAELRVQQFRGAAYFELPRRACAQASDGRQRGAARRALGGQQFRRLQAAQFGGERLLAVYLEHLEAPAGEVQRTDAETGTRFRNRDQQVVARGVKQRFVGERAGGHDARDLALDRPLAGRRVADLLADGHRDAGAHQPREVALDRVVGHAGHRDRRAGRSAAAGQRDVEQRGGALRVVVEQLVEVAHAVEQQLVRVL